jgi:hypothetical protein
MNEKSKEILAGTTIDYDGYTLTDEELKLFTEVTNKTRDLKISEILKNIKISKITTGGE